MGGKDWFVRLGQTEWQRYTYAREAGDPLQLLGSVRRGARIGALALTAEGEYVQVNGDHVSPLSSSQIRKALGKAQPPPRPPPARASAPRAPVVVVVKRRRIVNR